MSGVLNAANPSTSADAGYGLVSKAFSINYLKGLYDREGAWKHMWNGTGDVANFGESVTLPSMPRLTAVDVTPSTGAFAYDNTSVLAQTVQINKFKAVPYSIPEYLIKQSKIDLATALPAEAARAVSDTVDHEMVKLISALSTNSAGSANADLTEPYIWQALQALVVNHVDLSNMNDFVWILPATQFAAVHTLKGYTNFRLGQGSVNTDGSSDVKAQVMTLAGIDVHFRSDSEMSVTSGKIGGLFYRDSVGVAFQRTPSMRQPMPIPGTINTEFLTYAMYGISTIKESVAVKILCK